MNIFLSITQTVRTYRCLVKGDFLVIVDGTQFNLCRGQCPRDCRLQVGRPHDHYLK